MKTFIPAILPAGLLLALSLMIPPECAASGEFAGPFPSWRNVKTFYGAVGDGKTDDTAAIQKGLDELRFHKEFCVLYFPAGTYRITQPLKTVRESHTESMGISLIGEHPLNTAILWDGQKGAEMIRYSAWYSKISRLTLDGAGKAAVCLAYGPGFSTYNETSDMVFKDARIGLLLGGAAHGQAENAVLRCRFLRCSDAGLRTANFNSMDIWVWYSRFEDCGYGMHNMSGNFHAYQSLFQRSAKADIKTDNLMVFSFVNNTSQDSACFLDFSGLHSWGSPVSITGNRIFRCKNEPAIRLGNGGPYFLADNVIKSREGYGGPAVQLTWGDQILAGNRYTARQPLREDIRKGRLRRIDDEVVEPASVPEDLPSMPETPPNAERPIFEVPSGADAAGIQAVIDEAARHSGLRPVVHFSKGDHRIAQTIEIPAECDIELVGDGAAETATVLRWIGETRGLLLRLKGPSHAVLRDFMVIAPAANAILVEDADQDGGKIYANQLNVNGVLPGDAAISGLIARGVERSDVQLDNLQGGQFSRNWIRVIGGSESRAGGQGPGQVSVFAGATSSADSQYSVLKGGRLVVRSVYHEMSRDDVLRAILLDDEGSLSLDATRFSYKISSEMPLIELDGFKGDFTMMTGLLLPVDSKSAASILVGGDGSRSRLLCMGNLFWVPGDPDTGADDVFSDKSVPPARASMTLCNMNFNIPEAKHKSFGILEDRGAADDDYVRQMLSPLRGARVWFPGDARDGITRVGMHRIFCMSGKASVGVEIRAGAGEKS